MKYIIALLLLTSCHVTRITLTSENDVKKWTKEAIDNYFKDKPLLNYPRSIDPGFYLPYTPTPFKLDDGKLLRFDASSIHYLPLYNNAPCKQCQTLELRY